METIKTNSTLLWSDRWQLGALNRNELMNIGFVSIINAMINILKTEDQRLDILERDGDILRINTPYLIEIIKDVNPAMLEEIAAALKTIEVERQVKVAA